MIKLINDKLCPAAKKNLLNLWVLRVTQFLWASFCCFFFLSPWLSGSGSRKNMFHLRWLSPSPNDLANHMAHSALSLSTLSFFAVVFNQPPLPVIWRLLSTSSIDTSSVCRILGVLVPGCVFRINRLFVNLKWFFIRMVFQKAVYSASKCTACIPEYIHVTKFV